jgi:hypothetical protein
MLGALVMEFVPMNLANSRPPGDSFFIDIRNRHDWPSFAILDGAKILKVSSQIYCTDISIQVEA